MSYITFKNICKSYDNKTQVLKGIDLEVEEGELLTLLGPSGCGKSTLLRCLAGLEQVQQGHILLEGRDIYALSDKQRTILRRRRIGFVFQFYNLVPELTAWQNIVLPLNLDGRRPDAEYLNAVVETLGLTERLGHFAGELSGGQQQRVAIARALASKPAVILADEPTGNLDGRSGGEVLELLHLSRRRFGQTLVLVTHDLRIAEGADRVLTLEDGLVAADSTSDSEVSPV